MTDCRHWVLMLSALHLCSCSAPEQNIDFATTENATPAAIEQGRRIAEYPEGFLRGALERCESLASYEVDFYKQERVAGLFGEVLRPEEHMRAKFRAEPFSVKMTMLNESHDFSETVTKCSRCGNLEPRSPRDSRLRQWWTSSRRNSESLGSDSRLEALAQLICNSDNDSGISNSEKSFCLGR